MSRSPRPAFSIWLYGVTALLAIALIPALALPRRVLMAGIAVWSRLQIWGLRNIGGVEVEIRGLEHLPSGGALLAGKHQSMFDIVPPFVFLPDACFVLKKELMDIPVFGWHCAKARMIPVDREAHAKALKYLVVQAADRIASGRQLIIFPEGTRRPAGVPPAYKPGVAALYRELGLPCIPVATNSGEHLTSSGTVRRPGRVVFEILEPIPAGLKRGEFMRHLEERLEGASEALRLQLDSVVAPSPCI